MSGASDRRSARALPALDSPFFLISALMVHLSAPQAFITAPAFVQAMVQFAGLTPAQAGYVAAAENLGKAVAATVLLFIVGRVDWRRLVQGALALLVVGNLLTMFAPNYGSLLVVRFLCGLGPGMVVPLAYAMIGMTSKPDRNFGLLLTSLLVYASLAFLVLPPLFDRFGLQGGLAFYATFAMVGLLFSRAVPPGNLREEVRTDTQKQGSVDVPLPLRTIALATMSFYFIAMHGSWAYMSLMGTAGGLSRETVAHILTISQPFGILGGIAVTIMGQRFDRIAPIMLGLAVTAGALALMLGEVTPLVFSVTTIVFTFLWNNTHPYLLAAMSSFEKKGRTVVYGTVLQMYGVAAGPAIAAYVVGDGRYNNVILMGCAALVMAAVCILPALIWQRQARRALLARESAVGVSG